MKHLAVTLVAALLVSACAAPGSSIGRIAFSGQVARAPEKLALEVTLPKHYGLGGLDLVMNEPEDFGHKDKTIKIEVTGGSFSHEFEPLVYHITFWLLPPLGGYPRHPPAPVYVVRFSDAPEEVYLVGMDDGAFRYEVYARATKEKIKHEEATWLLDEGDYVLVETDGKDVWHLKIKAKPNKALQPTASLSLDRG